MFILPKKTDIALSNQLMSTVSTYQKIILIKMTGFSTLRDDYLHDWPVEFVRKRLCFFGQKIIRAFFIKP
ncbi:hypothetical protein DC094_19365 [Pelagibaculum spongiae]|uniref:Uncharacterized protein n=1 Tax=Pelagibaculum spongiae TaxID=2080658 RepID=A0A2V1GX99_9GAMM|nr:hypothetical protein DC094_19365 [Pelagibaculum spongiae]